MPTFIHNFYDNKCGSIHTLIFSFCFEFASPHPLFLFYQPIAVPSLYIPQLGEITDVSTLTFVHWHIYACKYTHFRGYFVIVLLKHIYV